ncbi:MAG: hypothetical protein K2P88_06940 [Chitinophagaceae bacterium]|uniref:hypothetical protein n=1 Tax=unclassified Paraflavitalea TaxID=2798305 RepID=UPI003D3390F5|nr:hypothetical protein [Chitinophagaceae bacterium]
MKVTGFLLSIWILFNPFQLFAQRTTADSIFYEFEKCLSSYFKKEFKKIDTSYLFFYGNKFNVSMDLKTFDLDGGRSFVNDFKDALDSSHLNDTSHKAFFFRGMSFEDFLNYIITQKTVYGVDCIIRNVKGVLVFVDCPDELWQHFYFDKVLYKKIWILTPVVDVFNSDGVETKHSRFILLCSFTPEKGFRVTKKYPIYEYKSICTQ